MNYDTKNINIYSYDGITLTLDGVEVEVVGENLYADGDYIGDVWLVGGTGRRLYALDDHSYNIVASGHVRIEYMNAGYFEKIVEYDFGQTKVNLKIADYSTKEISYDVNAIVFDVKQSSNAKQTDIFESYVYTDSELEALNRD